VESPVCDICHAADETADHVIFGCPAARQFCEAIQIPTDDSWSVIQLQQITNHAANTYPRQTLSNICAIVLLAYLEVKE